MHAIAFHTGNMCPQKIKTHEAAFAPLRFGVFNQSEGCLYLDVYTPDVAGKRTVLVHIHGGGFQFGRYTYSSVCTVCVIS